MRKLAAPLALFMILWTAVAPSAVQGQPVPIIRDAEIEAIIRTYATPLFQAAGLSPQAITVYLVDDDSLNAFVTPGLRMFIHTGLILQTEDPGALIGVIAHETGHLAGGHTATRGDALERAQMGVLASTILGLGAAILTGRGEAAHAVMSSGKDVALKGLLSYTRGQESAADQAAVRFLNATGQSLGGLVEFMHALEDQEVLLSSNQDPYLRTHPLTGERIRFLQHQDQISPNYGKPSDPQLVALHSRMRAKLAGFLETPEQVARLYPESDTSRDARYARAIVEYREAHLENALPLIEGLIAEEPDNPYFHELKGQMLFENGRLAEALEPYQKAVALAEGSPQLELGLARVLIELDRPGDNEAALPHLDAVLRDETGNALAWRLKAVAHGRIGETGDAALALAEMSLARGDHRGAISQAARALDQLPENSPGWLRAQDLKQLAEREDKEN